MNNPSITQSKDINLNTKSIVSLTFGVTALFIGYFSLAGIAIASIGFILAFLSLREIHYTAQRGRALAVAALTCNALAILLPLITIMINLILLTPVDFKMVVS
ncbi:hypothetical protein BpOF4_17495 [Alkalihalophilus pseudofirmus OF4]|uniref:DUF4190 domain-containing protein n=1 Tax=Alkalihalophilus pseudofirmus (strain ATCC BAA-2126 / JCM 17055 / OF4) TaxID=398511 RepID=D3FRE9_ALKPO|nr:MULTISPECIES: DUF4190 domain-containing protein [Alkalihalophilus]ADC51540.1 hypothetical protein BpOF4_17495 [Alkalihalophilus pseudofirmus OF4]MED1603549.1 DUF4190 domain-containing protein [Alkalihalophilus marmarensis]